MQQLTNSPFFMIKQYNGMSGKLVALSLHIVKQMKAIILSDKKVLPTYVQAEYLRKLLTLIQLEEQ